MSTEKHIKYNGSFSAVLSCDTAKHGKAIIKESVYEIAKMKPQYFVMRDASAANDNVLDNFEQIFKHYSPDTIRRIL